MVKHPSDGIVARNRRARYDYKLGDRYEAGLALHGTEVKTLREGKGSIAQAWVKLDDHGEAWLMQAHIPEYEYGNRANHDPTRQRKLLLHRRELERLAREYHRDRNAIVPTKLYFSDGYAKVEVAVATGKTQYDKRQTEKARDARREADRAVAEFQRG